MVGVLKEIPIPDSRWPVYSRPRSHTPETTSQGGRVCIFSCVISFRCVTLWSRILEEVKKQKTSLPFWRHYRGWPIPIQHKNINTCISVSDPFFWFDTVYFAKNASSLLYHFPQVLIPYQLFSNAFYLIKHRYYALIPALVENIIIISTTKSTLLHVIMYIEK